VGTASSFVVCMMRLVIIFVGVRIDNAMGFSCYAGARVRYGSDLMRYRYSSRNMQTVEICVGCLRCVLQRIDRIVGRDLDIAAVHDHDDGDGRGCGEEDSEMGTFGVLSDHASYGLPYM
jgi:hypothetical protein